MASTVCQTIIQWNCRSIRNKKHELSFLINKYKPFLLATSETWLKPSSRFRVPGFSCLRDDNTDGWGGCAILVKHSLHYSLCQIPQHAPGINIVAIRTLGSTFISLYIPHPNPFLISELETILTSLPGPLIVMGDFNCHNTLWGSLSCDNNSALLLDIFDSSNLCILNNGSPTRRTSPLQNPSAVDLSLCSAGLAPSLDWQTLSRSFGSDHYPILISFPTGAATPPPLPPLLKFRLDKADWEEFSSLVENEVQLLPTVTHGNVLELYNSFVSILNRSANSCFPVKNSSKNKIPSPPWWDSECTSAIKDRDRAEAQFLADLSNMENYLSFQKSNARCKKLLLSKKRQGWTRFCESLSPRTPPSIVWKNIKRYRGALSQANHASNEPSVWLDAFLDKLAPPYVPSEDCFPPFPSPSSSDRMDEPFCFSELSSVLANLKDSSPGVDGIPYSFIKNCTDLSKRFLLSLFNAIYECGTIPNLWKQQIVIPLLKPNKDPSDPSSRRPIALSSVLAKILEHLIKNRLEWMLESRHILSTSQFGFRRGLGTMDSLSTLTSDIRLALSRGHHLVGVFLDISSAYDNVQLPLLRQKMQQLSIPRKMIHVICNLFMERSIRVRSGNIMLPARTIWKGLPQGSVLSPILYNLYTSDLDRVVDSFCDILQYADDIVLYYHSDSFLDCSSRLNAALRYLNEWLQDHGLSLSPSKSRAVVFSRKRWIPDFDIVIDEESVNIEDSIKFLGVYLDSRMTGVPHLKHVQNKCEKSINVMRALSGAWWGAHPYSQKLLYNAIVRSHLDYGTFLLEPCSKLSLSCLDKIQSRCLRIIAGAMKSSPINALQVECLDPPLRLRRQFLSDRFLLKSLQYSYHPLISRLLNLSQIIPTSKYWTHKETPCLVKTFQNYSDNPPILKFAGNPLFSINFDALIFQPNIILSFGINKDTPFADSVFNKALAEKWEDWTSVFTDASKLSEEGFVGSAVWIPRYKIVLSFRCHPKLSVFSGEAIALFEAVSYVESHKINKTIIFSDCLSCLQDIDRFPFRNKDNLYINLKTREILHKCYLLGIEVVLAWIPGHAGIAGNEQADACAKQATQIGCTSHTKCFSQDIRALAKGDLRERWSQEWNISRLSKGKLYGDIQPNLPIKPWFFKCRTATKHATSTIIRLRLGHACTPSFLAKIRVRDHSLCECGLEEGTPDHIFFNCTKIPVSLYDYLPDFIPRPANFRTTLSFVNTNFVHVLTQFISHFNIKL